MGLKAYYSKGKIEVGCDEAGRGCLAGPVVAAAVILPSNFRCPGLNDSKQIAEAKREEYREIIEKKAIDWAVGIVDNEEIDRINILNASFLAMHRAIEQLKKPYECLLIDGNRFKPYKNVEHFCIIRGDAKFRSIAAASILAKTHRDEIMRGYCNEFPLYQWSLNKGYATKHHRDCIEKHGRTKYHRQSFKLAFESEQQSLIFEDI